MAVSVSPLGPVGAEVSGIDLAVCPDEDIAEIRKLLGEHGVVFFRDQDLSPEEHISLARRFGPINVNRFFTPHPDHAEIAMVVKEAEDEHNIGGAWHTDHSYDSEPALGSILVARELPPQGGATLFASMMAAYTALDDQTKELIGGLSAVHSARHIFGSGQRVYGEGNPDYEGRLGNSAAADALVDTVHPMVIAHPISGTPTL